MNQTRVRKIDFPVAIFSENSLNARRVPGELQGNLKHPSRDVLQHRIACPGHAPQQIAALRNDRLAGYQGCDDALDRLHTGFVLIFTPVEGRDDGSGIK